MTSRPAPEATESYLSAHAGRLTAMFELLDPIIRTDQKVGVVGISDFDQAIADRFQKATFTYLVPNLDLARAGMPGRTLPSSLLLADFSVADFRPTQEFDLILMLEVLEHILAPDDQVLRNVSRTLSEGGTLVLSVPNAVTIGNRIRFLIGKNVFWDKARILHGVNGGMGHIREYTVDDIRKLLSADFEILSLAGVNGYRTGIAKALNVLPTSFSNTIVSIARKRQISSGPIPVSDSRGSERPR